MADESAHFLILSSYNRDDISPGEIYVVSKRNVKRFNGNFQDYKNIIRKSIVKKE
jgi:hypothetical protein